jgi:hypothetical protein
MIERGGSGMLRCSWYIGKLAFKVFDVMGGPAIVRLGNGVAAPNGLDQPNISNRAWWAVRP